MHWKQRQVIVPGATHNGFSVMHMTSFGTFCSLQIWTEHFHFIFSSGCVGVLCISIRSTCTGISVDLMGTKCAFLNVRRFNKRSFAFFPQYLVNDFIPTTTKTMNRIEIIAGTMGMIFFSGLSCTASLGVVGIDVDFSVFKCDETVGKVWNVGVTACASM